MKRPESLLPLAFFALAVAGMLWADGPWAVRLQGLHPVSKLLVIPLLLYHFSRSRVRPGFSLHFLLRARC